VLGFWSLPGGLARAGAAAAQPEPARQRGDSLPTVVVVLLVRGHPLSLLKSYLVCGIFLFASNR
jgi:hypothetical protein